MDERRRLSFGGVADLYHRSRPSYPEALVDGVLEFAGAGESDRAVEVGAGTGKATVLFAARGLDVVGIEPSAEMAQLARRNCAGYENVTIEEIEFERWRPPGHEFRLALLGTHSACVVLDAPGRERLLGDIAAAIDARGGRFRMTYATVLCLARAS
jgi:SAM-dependent methyltransferase